MPPIPPVPAVALLGLDDVPPALAVVPLALAVVPPPPVVAGVDPPHAAVSASNVKPRFVPLMRPMVPSSRSPTVAAHRPTPQRRARIAPIVASRADTL
jgi:hypothetical protein